MQLLWSVFWIFSLLIVSVTTFASSTFDLSARTYLVDENGKVPPFVETTLERHFGRQWSEMFATVGIIASKRFLNTEIQYFYNDRTHRRERKRAMEYIRRRFLETLNIPLGLDRIEKELYENSPDHPLFQSIAPLDFNVEVMQAIAEQADPFFSFDLVNMTLLDLAKIFYGEELYGKGYVILSGPARRQVRLALTETLGQHFLRRFAPDFVLGRNIRANDFAKPIATLMAKYKVVSVEDFLMMMETEEFDAFNELEPSAVQDAVLRLRSYGFGFVIPARILEDPSQALVAGQHGPEAIEGLGGLAVRVRPIIRRPAPSSASEVLARVLPRFCRGIFSNENR